MPIWQIAVDPDLRRHNPHISMIFSWIVWQKCRQGVSLMEALEAESRGLLSGISSNLMAVTYGEKIRRCGKNLWISILSPRPLKGIEKNGKAIWPLFLSRQIPAYQFMNTQLRWIPGIISGNTQTYKEHFSSLTKTVLLDTEHGSSHFSESPEVINGLFCPPRQATPGWTTAPYLSLMDSTEIKRISALNMLYGVVSQNFRKSIAIPIPKDSKDFEIAF